MNSDELSDGFVKSSTDASKPTSLVLAISFSVAAFLFAFVQAWISSFGVDTLPRFARIFDHPQALGGLVAEAVGGSLIFPATHMALASVFKSKRNPSSRRRIFIGWSIFTIILGLVSLGNA